MIQLVVPDSTVNMNGVVLAGSAIAAERLDGVTKRVVVLKKVDVAVRVTVGEGESNCSLDSAAALGQTVRSTKTEVV